MAINAFPISWTPCNFYAFPPFSVIPKVLQKIQVEEATGLLIVPCWPTQPWWLLVMRLLVLENLVLPKKKHRLFLPQQPDLVHPLHQKLTLLMCHLSGKSLEGRGLLKLTTSLTLQSWRKGTKQQHKPFITYGNNTVVKGRLIPFQQL